MPPIGVLFAFLVEDVVISVELSFSWYSMGSSWTILWSIIPRMSILYLLKWLMSSSCLLFFQIVHTFTTDIVKSFLKFRSLNFPLFLFLSAITLPEGFKDIASFIASWIALILPSTVV